MNKLRNLVVIGVLASVALLAAGWVFLVSPERSHAAKLKTDADGVRSSTSSLQTQLAMLRAQAKSLPAQRAKLQAISAKVPNNPAEPALVRALTKAADSAGVELTSIAPSTPAVMTAPVAPVAPAATGAAPAAGTPPVAASLQVAAIALKITATGTYFELEQFQRNLENLSRALKSTTISLAPGGDKVSSTSTTAASGGYTGTLTASIGATVYMTVERAAAPLAGAGAVAPGPTK